MDADRLVMGISAGLVAATLASGAWLATSLRPDPAERRDRQRLQALHEVIEQVDCLTRESGALPATIAPTEDCPGAGTLRDPLNGAPYLYERRSEIGYTLCAGFENLPGLIQARHPVWGYEMPLDMPPRLDPETGCAKLSRDLG